MKELTGPWASDLNHAFAELATWDAQLAALEVGMREAAQDRDLAKLIEYRQQHAAIPQIQSVIHRECDELARRRMQEISQQAISDREAIMAELPPREVISNVNDPASKTLVIRAKL
jgi:hypothetical protein